MDRKLRKLLACCVSICFFIQTFISQAQAGNFSLKGVYGSHSVDPYSGGPIKSFDVAVGDLDGSGVIQNAVETLPTNGTRKLLYLKHRLLQQLGKAERPPGVL